jgi:hypothetical protein
MFKRISMEEFEHGYKVSRVVYKSGKVRYIGKFKHYNATLVLNMDDYEDLEFLDKFAYDEIKRKIINNMG